MTDEGVYARPPKVCRLHYTVGTPPRTNNLDPRAHADAVGIAVSAIEATLDALAQQHEVLLVRNIVSGPETEFDTDHVHTSIRYEFIVSPGQGRRRVPPAAYEGQMLFGFPPPDDQKKLENSDGN